MLLCCLGSHHTNLRLCAKLLLLSVFSFHWEAFKIQMHTFMHYHNITDFLSMLFMHRLHKLHIVNCVSFSSYHTTVCFHYLT